MTELKYTPKQRLALYKEALRYIVVGYNTFLCNAIEFITDKGDGKFPIRLFLPSDLHELPEFAAIKPQYAGSVWFRTRNERIRAMEGIIANMEGKLKIKK